jgi:hypothetical protein
MALHDFYTNVQLLSGPVYQPTGILPVRPNLGEAWIAVFAGREQGFGSVAIILVGRGDKDLQYPSVCIYEEVTLAAFDLFMPVITDVLLATAPPFSVVLTDWLSKTAAEGVGSRPTRARSASHSAA